MREFTSPASLMACRQLGVEGCREAEEGVGIWRTLPQKEGCSGHWMDY